MEQAVREGITTGHVANMGVIFMSPASVVENPMVHASKKSRKY